MPISFFRSEHDPDAPARPSENYTGDSATISIPTSELAEAPTVLCETPTDRVIEISVLAEKLPEVPATSKGAGVPERWQIRTMPFTTPGTYRITVEGYKVFEIEVSDLTPDVIARRRRRAQG